MAEFGSLAETTAQQYRIVGFAWEEVLLSTMQGSLVLKIADLVLSYFVMALGVVAVAFEIDVSFNADYHARFLRTNVELK